MTSRRVLLVANEKPRMSAPTATGTTLVCADRVL